MLIPKYIGLLNTCLVFFMLIATRSSENMEMAWKFGLAISLSTSSLSLTSLTSTRFLMFSMLFPNTELFISLKKSFSKSFFALVLRLVFMLMYSASQLDSWNVMALWILVNFNPKDKYSFRVSWWTTYFVLLFKLGTSFSTLPSVSLSGARGHSLCRSWSTVGHSRSTSRIHGMEVQLSSSCNSIHLKFDNGSFWTMAWP